MAISPWHVARCKGATAFAKGQETSNVPLPTYTEKPDERQGAKGKSKEGDVAVQEVPATLCFKREPGRRQVRPRREEQQLTYSKDKS
jgi:hypothetical protein